MCILRACLDNASVPPGSYYSFMLFLCMCCQGRYCSLRMASASHAALQCEANVSRLNSSGTLMWSCRMYSTLYTCMCGSAQYCSSIQPRVHVAGALRALLRSCCIPCGPRHANMVVVLFRMCMYVELHIHASPPGGYELYTSCMPSAL